MSFFLDEANILKTNDFVHEPLIFEDAIGPELCDTIIKRFALPELKVKGTIADEQGTDNEGEYDAEARVVDIYEFDFDSEEVEGPAVIELYQEMETIVTSANEYFDFDIVGFLETTNLLHYHCENETPITGHFCGHTDFGPGTLSQRKLTTIIQLSDPSDYEGCDLNLVDYGNAPKERGTAIVFPSYMYHSVSPIIKGNRFALNFWTHGNPFR